ncbi:hypothetical protein Pan97_50590 [Bremerella volcania]|uniref:Peptidylprolyl isomerase n=1 Tax=Bremerella volcania TaxID=2527984 RepID=A0A518CFH3_9BACT|nr:hypothetical protein [Bremerella volcania]QDU77980.1 hypothetical protein Pan97_50590 [Bremerella volcania]
MRTIVLTFLLLLASTQVTTAQQVNYIGPGNVRLPDGLVSYMRYLQAEQLESLKLFTTYLEKRVEEKAVPEGILLNAQAIYTEAQLRATDDRAVKQEKLDELVEIENKRIKLDSQTPNTTWFGVDRVAIGKMMKAEYEAFSKEAALPEKTSSRKLR